MRIRGAGLWISFDEGVSPQLSPRALCTKDGYAPLTPFLGVSGATGAIGSPFVLSYPIPMIDPLCVLLL